MKQFIPCNLLKPFIRSYRIIESSTGMENSILPDTSLVIAFRLKGTVYDKAQKDDHQLPEYVFSGLRNQPRIIQYVQNSATLLVNFREQGASAFFDIPLQLLFGQNISLDNFIPQAELTEIREKLIETNNDIERIGLAERFFIKRLNEKKIDKLVTHSVEIIKREKGNLRISQLIKDLHISKDLFEKRFRKSIGASPKQFANIVRMNHCIAEYDAHRTLTRAALDAGYYDQSHFIHVFKLFTGRTPLQFFNAGI